MGLRHVAAVTLLVAGVLLFLLATEVKDDVAVATLDQDLGYRAGEVLMAASILHLFLGIWVVGSRVVGPWVALASVVVVAALTLLQFAGFGRPWPVDWYWLPLMVTLILAVVAAWCVGMYLLVRAQSRPAPPKPT